jgi:ribA/ribD-fused uncharacterized protein
MKNVHDIFESLGLHADRILLASVSRRGTFKPGKCRPIVVQFVRMQDRHDVLLKRRESKKINITIVEDLPPEIATIRSKLVPSYQAALNISHLKERVSLGMDTLYLDGKSYTCNNLHELPVEIRPETLCEKYDVNTMCFFHGESKLSNFHITSFKFRDTAYNSSEQAFHYTCAMTFGDTSRAQMILEEPSPRRQKGLSEGIKGYDEITWKSQQFDVMLAINTAKFSQVTELREHLLSTGTRVIGESNPRDTYWGTGIPTHDKDSLNPSKWQGENNMGKILMSLREQFK